ncbi:MAG: AraC family transcriptional regulator [Aquaticitalea sp.]
MKPIDLIQADTMNGLYNDIKGSIKIHQITEYISWIEMNVTPEEDVCVKLNEVNNVYMHFMYNLKDTISLTSMGTSKDRKLSSFESAIIHEKRGFDTFLNLKKNGAYQLRIVQITKYNKDEDINDFFLQVEEVFKSLSDKYYFMHTGLPNLQLGEYVRKLTEMPKNTLSEKLMASGYIHILLSIKLEQFVEFIKNPVQPSVLSSHELERVQKITEAIIINPEANYNIDELCREWGLSANKLQLGFKEMHSRTVCSYINHIRLMKAEELLKTTDLNVSEIVYSLGWSSRSYFCKIFKEKYLCSPKNYQLLLVSA